MEAYALYNDLLERVKSYHPAKEYSLLERAYRLADEAHAGQMRHSGEPYIIHPLKVALILADMELDLESIVAGVLHDIIEDTTYTYEDISHIFGEEVALLVDGVTKLGKIEYSSKEEFQAENMRKMLLAMAKDIRVILIKLADRLHNMRTLDFMTPEKQIEKSQETMDIYAPLADRLGISKIKTELEDIAFKYLKPNEFKDLIEKIEQSKKENDEFVNRVVKDVSFKLSEAGIKAKVYGRDKQLFSIYKKMHNQDKSFEQIYDLFAVRILVDSVRDCYAALGVVHDMYKPMPGRFKDYIAMPKPNMYQSLHNTLIGPEGQPFEVQIRTWEMHKTAEYGISAHWKYKEGKTDGKPQTKEEQKLAWLRQILEWQKDMSDNKEFLDTLKMDLNIYTDQVYAFTPRGDVISLPKGSTPIDYAYSIHSAIGNKMVGARVNGKIVTFDYEVQNGDRIEVITSQNSKGPSSDWLKIIKSSQARTKINQWFKKEFKEENIVKGKELLEKDAKKKGYTPSELFKPEWFETVCNKFAFKSFDTLCAAIGYGGLKEGQVVNRFIEEFEKEAKKNRTAEEILAEMEKAASKSTKPKRTSGIIVKGVGNVNVRFSKCCNPVPGDEIVGFITRGRGVSIHRTDCVNIINLSENDRNRLLETEWDDESGETENLSYFVEIKIICNDRKGLIMDISRVLSEENLLVKSFNGRSTKAGLAAFNVIMETHSKEQLEKICNKIAAIKDVEKIERVTS